MENLTLKSSLKIAECIEQDHDGAASLGVHNSGQAGAAVIFEKSAPHADYFHCMSHASNLPYSGVRRISC
jgi:hypothetical protein